MGEPDALSAKSQFSIRPLKAESGARASVHPADPCTRQNRVSRSLAAGLVFLAITVAFWGCAYKISRYDLQSDPASRILFAKLWDKHDDVEQLARHAGLTAHSRILLPLQVEVVPLIGILVIQGAALCLSGECERSSLLFLSDISLRAPPFRSLLL